MQPLHGHARATLRATAKIALKRFGNVKHFKIQVTLAGIDTPLFRRRNTPWGDHAQVNDVYFLVGQLLTAGSFSRKPKDWSCVISSNQQTMVLILKLFPQVLPQRLRILCEGSWWRIELFC